MRKQKFSLDALNYILPVLDEVEQRGFIGGGNGSYSNPYTKDEYLSKVSNCTWSGGYVDSMGYVGENDNVSWNSDGSAIVGSGTDSSPYSAFTFENWSGDWHGGYVYGADGIIYIGPDNIIYGSYGGTSNGNDNSNSYYGSQILESAKQYEGVKYVSGGSSMSGMDCSGLITKACNLSFRWTTSQPLPSSRFSVISTDNSSTESFISSLRSGDILVWRGQHAAIYVGGNSIYHANSSGVN